jgi:hypothetical protein
MGMPQCTSGSTGVYLGFRGVPDGRSICIGPRMHRVPCDITNISWGTPRHPAIYMMHEASPRARFPVPWCGGVHPCMQHGQRRAIRGRVDETHSGSRCEFYWRPFRMEHHPRQKYANLHVAQRHTLPDQSSFKQWLDFPGSCSVCSAMDTYPVHRCTGWHPQPGETDGGGTTPWRGNSPSRESTPTR